MEQIPEAVLRAVLRSPHVEVARRVHNQPPLSRRAAVEVSSGQVQPVQPHRPQITSQRDDRNRMGV